MKTRLLLSVMGTAIALIASTSQAYETGYYRYSGGLHAAQYGNVNQVFQNPNVQVSGNYPQPYVPQQQAYGQYPQQYVQNQVQPQYGYPQQQYSYPQPQYNYPQTNCEYDYTMDCCQQPCCPQVCCNPCCELTPMMFGNADFRSSFLYNGGLNQPGLAGSAFGGSVGRTKVSEWNSARPTDRIFFNYDYYDNVQYGFDMDVDRMMIGFEKASKSGRSSIMVRVPFAATQSTSIAPADTTNSDVELGSVDITYKYLLYDGCNFDFSMGVLAGYPTNSDLITGSVVVDNESIQITPFMAGLYDRDRLFVQTFAAVAIDATGSPVRFVGVPIGRHREQQVLDLDLQVGYWLFKNNCTGGGVAPFVELHYSTPISSRDDTYNFIPGVEQRDFDELVMGTGIQFVSYRHFSGAVAINLPLVDSLDRSADYQVGCRLEYRR
ncbi:MAG: hypothetical protein KDA78_01150 [Planctomycetaceae bacterium]|nr:hypothetical protein [Planctomycetaceae bacterium]